MARIYIPERNANWLKDALLADEVVNEGPDVRLLGEGARQVAGLHCLRHDGQQQLQQNEIFLTMKCIRVESNGYQQQDKKKFNKERIN